MEVLGGAAPVVGRTQKGRTALTAAMRLIMAIAIVASVGMGLFRGGVHHASAGEAGTIVTDGAPLMVHLYDHTVIDWIPSGARVDIMWQQDGMTEILYNGQDGWVWDADIALDGGGGGVGGYTGDVQTTDAAGSGAHWIDVNRTSATVTLYVGTTAVAQYSARIGRDPSVDGFYSTAVGTFHVFSMQKGLSSTPFVDDVYLSDWVGFDPDRKNGFHSPVRNADGSVRQPQNQTTMGCVRLGESEAKAVFAFAEIGMRVEIHD